MGLTDPTDPNWRFYDLKYIRELWLALRERQAVLGQDLSFIPTTANKARSLEKVRLHQEWLEANCTRFARSHYLSGGSVLMRGGLDDFDGWDADEPLTYTLEEWRQVSGLHPDGFTRITGMHPSVYDHGLVQVGDYIDRTNPVYWQEIIAGYKTLLWPLIEAQWAEVESYEGNCFHDDTWAKAKTAAEADWHPGGATEWEGPHALSSATCWTPGDYHSHLGRRSAKIGAWLNRPLPMQILAYATVRRMEGSNSPIFDGNGIYDRYENKWKPIGSINSLPVGNADYFTTIRDADASLKPRWCPEPTADTDYWQGYYLDVPAMILAPGLRFP